VIRSAGGWKVRSVTGAIVCTPRGRTPRLYLRITKGTIRHPEVIRFLKHLRSHARKKIILVMDRLPAHRAGNTQQFIRQQQSWLTVKWFPSYAPELNPVEYLWSASKQKDYANYCPDTMTELDGRIRVSTRRIRRKPRLLNGFLRASGLFHS
jgi:transposase